MFTLLRFTIAFVFTSVLFGSVWKVADWALGMPDQVPAASVPASQLSTEGQLQVSTRKAVLYLPLVSLSIPAPVVQPPAESVHSMLMPQALKGLVFAVGSDVKTLIERLSTSAVGLMALIASGLMMVGLFAIRGWLRAK